MTERRFVEDHLVSLKDKLAFRSEGFSHIFGALEDLGREFYTIVETGCSRKAVGDGIVYGEPVPEGHPWYPGGTQGPWADGQSTCLFDEFLRRKHGHVFTIDIDAENCNVCRRNTSHRVTAICGDSVRTLSRMDRYIGRNRTIDLLYLDSYDLDWDDPHPSALHHLKEMISANRFLTHGSIIAVDDNLNGHRRGKGLYLTDYMAAIEAELVFDGYQSVWIMRN